MLKLTLSCSVYIYVNTATGTGTRIGKNAHHIQIISQSMKYLPVKCLQSENIPTDWYHLNSLKTTLYPASCSRCPLPSELFI